MLSALTALSTNENSRIWTCLFWLWGAYISVLRGEEWILSGVGGQSWRGLTEPFTKLVYHRSQSERAAACQLFCWMLWQFLSCTEVPIKSQNGLVKGSVKYTYKCLGHKKKVKSAYMVQSLQTFFYILQIHSWVKFLPMTTPKYL